MIPPSSFFLDNNSLQELVRANKISYQHSVLLSMIPAESLQTYDPRPILYHAEFFLQGNRFKIYDFKG